MMRPPTASGANTASRPSLNAAEARPPTGPGALNQIQELHQNNRLTRPDTGNARKTGALKEGGTGDDGLLNMLDESGQGPASHAGSHTSGALAVAAAATGSRGGHSRAGSHGPRREQFAGTVGSAADFERADEDIDLNEYVHDDSNDQRDSDDSDDVGSFYKPTLIAK